MKNFFSSDNGTSFYAIPEGQYYDAVPAGIYDPVHSHLGHGLKRCELTDQRLVPDPTQSELIKELDKFWEAKEVYAKAGFAHRRGFLLHGDPGAGKSSALRFAEANIVARGGVALRIGDDFNDFKYTAGNLRRMDKDIPLLVICEDLNEMIEENSERQVLEVLDGGSNHNHTVTLATSNNYAGLPERLKRASRFDTHIEVLMPAYEARLALIRSSLPDTHDTSRIALATTTDGQSMAQVKERILQFLVFDKVTKPRKASAKR